jgi:lysine-specific permease
MAVLFVVSSLGEMATLIPISGSFNTYAARFVDPALGFACGWTYYFQWVITLPIELIVAQGFVAFWLPDVDKVHVPPSPNCLVLRDSCVTRTSCRAKLRRG